VARGIRSVKKPENRSPYVLGAGPGGCDSESHPLPAFSTIHGSAPTMAGGTARHDSRSSPGRIHTSQPTAGTTA
jgi:hypothetical protein